MLSVSCRFIVKKLMVSDKCELYRMVEKMLCFCLLVFSKKCLLFFFIYEGGSFVFIILIDERLYGLVGVIKGVLIVMMINSINIVKLFIVILLCRK